VVRTLKDVSLSDHNDTMETVESLGLDALVENNAYIMLRFYVGLVRPPYLDL